jgi:hypothetical protein
MVNFAAPVDASAFLFLGVNSQVMSGPYASIGYFINEKYIRAVSIFRDMDDAPASVQVPIIASAIPYAVV